MAPNRLELSKEDRWGESVQNGFTSSIERDLAAQTGGAQVIVFPWYNTVHIDMQVQIDVYRFETDGQGTRDALGEMDDPRLDAVRTFCTRSSRHLTQPSKAGDMTEAAAALSRTIGDLSGQIANMVQRLRLAPGRAHDLILLLPPTFMGGGRRWSASVGWGTNFSEISWSAHNSLGGMNFSALPSRIFACYDRGTCKPWHAPHSPRLLKKAASLDFAEKTICAERSYPW